MNQTLEGCVSLNSEPFCRFWWGYLGVVASCRNLNCLVGVDCAAALEGVREWKGQSDRRNLWDIQFAKSATVEGCVGQFKDVFAIVQETLDWGELGAMEVIREKQAMREWSRAQRKAGERVALVPTMGYLHEGHLSLVREAKLHATKVVVSVYVNPSQFAPGEDLSTYPRDLEGDLRKLQVPPA